MIFSSNKVVIYLVIIMSIFIKFALSSDDDSDDESMRSLMLCMGNNTTTRDPFYQNYDTSVSSFLSQLAVESTQSKPIFSSTSIGKGRDKVYGSYMCWGDISSQLCNKCVATTARHLLKSNFYHECMSRGFYMHSTLCVVRYANYSVTEYKEGWAFTMGYIGVKVANYLPYNRTLTTTIKELIKEAGVGNWTTPNRAIRVVPVVGSKEEIHILVQCIPVISATNCSRCLRELYDFVPEHCNGTQGGYVVHPDCVLTFNNQAFIGGAYRSSSPSNFHLFCASLFFLSIVLYV